MFEIKNKRELAASISLFEIYAPLIAKTFKAGQFVMIRLEEGAERVPLTIADTDPINGTITLIVQAVGRSTKSLNALEKNQFITDVVGPLGRPSDIHKVGTVVVIGGGVGTAIAYPTAKAFKNCGNRVISIIGGRTKELIILEAELSKISDELYITTDDGSYGEKGLVTTKLSQLLETQSIDEVLAIGPIPMMKAVAEVTKGKKIKTTVSLNPIMIDGTGMCGGCRVNVGGKTLFACVDGPEFNAHEVDFFTLQSRNKTYHYQEQNKLNGEGTKTLSHEMLSEECHLSKELPSSLIKTTKDKLSIPRMQMSSQDPELRKHNFKEVNLGATIEQVQAEASRCLQCKNAACVLGCPVRVDIPAFLEALSKGDPQKAYEIIKKDNCLPAVTGRVCPQENQCEGVCIRAKRKDDHSVAIGYLERFAADWGHQHLKEETVMATSCPLLPKNKKVAIIGSGPAGLAAAGDLNLRGCHVEVFEALHEMGGVLMYGIPEFRLPKKIVRKEIHDLKEKGVIFRPNIVVGKTLKVGELLSEFGAVFVSSGAGLPVFLSIPGEDLSGVYSANEFLTRTNLMKAYYPEENETPIFDCRGKDIAVFGGGNTAMDAVRTALRLGALNAYLIYRRTMKEMPARLEELLHAKEEGTQILELAAPLEFSGDEYHCLNGVKLQRMELGPPDASGRRSPVAIKGSECHLPISMAIVAVGNGSNPLIPSTTPELKLNQWGNIIVDEVTMKSSMKGVFAGGDIVTGGATVILAMGAGRKAAGAIFEYLETGNW
ncbi:MAG: glutamate synthase (NADPH), homotetrameric [Bdellovibrionales bacterium RIFOXYA1_FULL_36_14]|nr:MAG: glutamate synthase (NADPH), homotetrameric [Bdellovibrionales bacterium RIFOXYA1_FULL_36_14]